MKFLAVSVLVCSMMALAGAAALQEAQKEHRTVAIIQEEEHHVNTFKRSCPHGWTKYNGYCLLYVPRAMSWAKAEKNCLSMSANLASVHNMDEYFAVQRIILNHAHQSEETWIGGSDSQEEGIWFWSDGTPFFFQNWCSGEPNNPQSQHCLQMNFRGSTCWDNVQCYLTRPSVCARKI